MPTSETKDVEPPSKTSGRNPHSGELGLIHPTIPGSELLKNAEALLEFLSYIERETETCRFNDLGLFVGTARMAAIELVHALREQELHSKSP